MKRNLLLALLSTAMADGFVTPDQQIHRLSNTPMVISQASSFKLNLGDFDEYAQTEDQDLAYQDTVIGSGDEQAQEGKFVVVAYKGQLMSTNKVFDEGSISFRVGERKVISGWERGLVGMRVGGKRTLKIPPVAAYGKKGIGKLIPPDSHLQFDVELKAMPSNVVEEKVAELASLNPFRKAAVLVVVGSLIYDLLAFGLHVI